MRGPVARLSGVDARLGRFRPLSLQTGTRDYARPAGARDLGGQRACTHDGIPGRCGEGYARCARYRPLYPGGTFDGRLRRPGFLREIPRTARRRGAAQFDAGRRYGRKERKPLVPFFLRNPTPDVTRLHHIFKRIRTSGTARIHTFGVSVLKKSFQWLWTIPI